jgi:hypothetical protein
MRSSDNDKILQILKHIDDVLFKKGMIQYEERIHKISKTLLSIEKHNNCFVSRFSVEHKNEEHIPVNVCSFDGTEATAPNLEEILSSIEDELDMTNDDSTLSSSSEEDTKVSGRINLQRRFNKIEAKLVSYLNGANDSKTNSMCSEKQRIPISKLPPQFTTTRIIKNFFEDREVIEASARRRSVSCSQKEQLEKLEATQKICKSNFDKITYKDEKDVSTTPRVSDFTEEVAANVLHVRSSKGSSFTFAKRDSIFAERRSIDQEKLMEQLRDASELTSSDDSDSFDC